MTFSNLLKPFYPKKQDGKEPNGYQGKEEKKKKPTGHFAGPVERIPTEDEIRTHIPLFEMQYYDPETEKPMTEQQINSARSAGTVLPPVFYNPMQSIDYRVIDAVCKNTIIGPIMNIFTQTIIGRGFHPEIELLNPRGDSKKDQTEIKKYRYVIDELRKVERQINDSNDIPFIDYVTMLIDAMNTYGRAALVYDSYTTYREKIPTTLKFAHPHDLSITIFDDRSWRLNSVLWLFGGHTPVPADSLVYLWNPLVTAKYKHAWQYGGSMVLPILDAGRALRRIVSEDFPAMAKATWARMFILAVRPQGQDESQKQVEYESIAKNLNVGEPNILMENPEDLSFNDIDYNPKIREFQELVQFLIKYCVASTGLPPSMEFDESDSNRSASRSKIQIMMATTVNPIRARLARQLTRQTYQKWFEILFPELTDKIKIRFVFEDLKISEWYDMVQAALQVDSRHQLTDDAFGKLAEIDDYTSLIEPGAETHAGGQGEKPHNIQRDNSGKNLDVGLSKNREGLEE